MKSFLVWCLLTLAALSPHRMHMHLHHLSMQCLKTFKFSIWVTFLFNNNKATIFLPSVNVQKNDSPYMSPTCLEKLQSWMYSLETDSDKRLLTRDKRRFSERSWMLWERSRSTVSHSSLAVWGSPQSYPRWDLGFKRHYSTVFIAYTIYKTLLYSGCWAGTVSDLWGSLLLSVWWISP